MLIKLYIINEDGIRIDIDELTDYGTDGCRYIRNPKDDRFIFRVCHDGLVSGEFDKHEEEV